MFLAATSELEAVLARGVRERLHAPVIAIARTVERDGFDAERLRAIGDAFADDCRGRLVAAVLDVLAHVALGGRSARDHLVARRRDELRVDVAVRAAHDEPRRALL